MSDKYPPSLLEFAMENLTSPEHPLQTCLTENGDQIGMAATIAQQSELIRLQAAEIERDRRMFLDAVMSIVAIGEAAGVRGEDQQNGSLEIVEAINKIQSRRDYWKAEAGKLRDEIAALKQVAVVEDERAALEDWHAVVWPSGSPLKGRWMAWQARARLNASRDVVPEDEQSVFEEWLARTCPSGDCESVQAQFEASTDYLDFHAAPTPAPSKPKGCTKPGCFPYCDCGGVDDAPDHSATYPIVRQVRAHLHTCACVTGDSGVCDCGAVVDGVSVEFKPANVADDLKILRDLADSLRHFIGVFGQGRIQDGKALDAAYVLLRKGESE